ncbi:ornithine carbamoyltransferase [Synechococcus sp. Nb3U1]|uniref:ornithine carbamoyltransferase n=1 Tax=Synechococcus sp. Nb3U1 TaxID=1914529 RepID=UPI001F1D861F|nr:ornithine carbamoyltransferase [Synechococcus sp. Nb3U1]MCF2972357.1 ornithine carbamoyltransferase [Synechococcus sp. Nb3U1]
MLKHWISLLDWDPGSLQGILRLGIEAFEQAQQGLVDENYKDLANKPTRVAFLSQKASLRTRLSFEVAVSLLRGQLIPLSLEEIGWGYRESIQDFAATLGLFVDAVVIRLRHHTELLELARWSTVPIINAMTDYCHPCQTLADVMTLEQEFGSYAGLRVAFVGHSAQEVCRSLAFAAAKFGFHLMISSPPEFCLDADSIQLANQVNHHEAVTLIGDPVQAVEQADAIYTDSWIQTGLLEKEVEFRLTKLATYQVNEALLMHAPSHAILLHCMPMERGREITDSVAEGSQSRILKQAKNRIYAQKGILSFLLGKQLAIQPFPASSDTADSGQSCTP